ncbi:MAG: T9SS type A sorting domain-containing protein, partial [Muribaculaceae bacterium]|nr:T9SS type A sorting domain-containing protein [Muribaculaceae bacterium]
VPVTIGAMSGMAPAEAAAERSVTVWGLDGTVVAAPVTGVLSDLPAGVYIVRTTSAGGRVSVDKLIVR